VELSVDEVEVEFELEADVCVLVAVSGDDTCDDADCAASIAGNASAATAAQRKRTENRVTGLISLLVVRVRRGIDRPATRRNRECYARGIRAA
jgi:hypothetical protein